MKTKLKHCPICRTTTRVPLNDAEPVCNACLRRDANDGIATRIFDAMVGKGLSPGRKAEIVKLWS